MRIFDRYLLVFLGLVALAGLAVLVPRQAGEPSPGASIHDFPQRLDGWVAVEGVPEEILPSDPRALATVRRTYAKEGLKVYSAISRYRSRNNPQWRPHLNLIGPERGAISVEHDPLQITLDGVHSRAIPVKSLAVRRRARQVRVVYWYQLGEQTIAGDYDFRLVHFVDTLLARRRELLLVRLATTDGDRPEAFTRAFYPQLMKIVLPEEKRPW